MNIGDTYINIYKSARLPAGALVVIEDISYDRVYYTYFVIEYIRLHNGEFHTAPVKHSNYTPLETFKTNFTKHVYI